ncbi:MAG: hypothetical protein RL391_826 [Actinomycetota bacterium]
MAEPVIPRYEGPNLVGVVPNFLLRSSGDRPEWFPVPAGEAERVVLLVLDGLGWKQFDASRRLMPSLGSFDGGPITTVAPSTTATALTSLVTGATPIEHGLVGYRMDMGDVVMNTLRWHDGRRDLRNVYRPSDVQPVPPFCGAIVPVVSRAEHEGTGFTDAHLRGMPHPGWRSASSIPVEIRHQLDAGRSFIYAYYDGIDKIAHERGFGDYYESELRHCDELVASILDALPPDVALVVVADHGQVDTGESAIHLPPALLEHLTHQSGEGRFRWLHVKNGCGSDAYAAAREFEPLAWVRTREEILDSGWFGRTGGIRSEIVGRRLGDIALVPHADVYFEDPLDSGPFPLRCRHGSLTEDEMLVPFLARRP